MKNILEIEDLTFSYDGRHNVLQDCNIEIESGKICSIVGESGSGKSTLLRLIAGLERPNDGSISIDQRVVSDNDRMVVPQERRVGFVFQNYALFPHMTVAENIAYGLTSDKKNTISRLLHMIQMDGYENAYPSQLSGGQQQRIALARTLATEPLLLLLDEPFSNLDTALKSELRNEIRRIVNELDMSMIFITHDLYDAIDIADDIIFIKDGKILDHMNISSLSKDTSQIEISNMVQELLDKSLKTLEVLRSNVRN